MPDSIDKNTDNSWLNRVGNSYRKLVYEVDAPVVGASAAQKEQDSLKALTRGQVVKATRLKAGAFADSFKHLTGQKYTNGDNAGSRNR